MRKLAAIICAAALAGAAAERPNTVDSVFIGPNAGNGARNIDRTVFIGSGAGWDAGHDPNDCGGAMVLDGVYNITSNLFIGAAAGLDGFMLGSNVGMGYRAFRKATNCVNCVGIGAEVFSGANGATNEVNINNQLFISPTNFWIFPQGNIGYFSNFDTLLTGMKNVLWVNGTVYATSIDGTIGDIALNPLGSQIVDDQGRTLYSMRNLIEHVRALQTRIEALEQAVYSPNPMMMSAPPPSNTSTNAPPSGD